MPGWELIGEEERQAMLELFEPTAQGSRFPDPAQARARIAAFEQAFAASLGVPYAIGVSSGSAALKVALKTLGVGPGDEVITQAHTFVATVEAIVECGATPIIAGIDATLNMDPRDLNRKITDKTKVILPVHMLGVAARMDEILEIARAWKVSIIEDACQACHGTYHGVPLGTLGALGCFSFSYSKLLTTGEGGMVVTWNEALANAARAYADHGHDLNPLAPSRGQDTHTYPGFNYRMGVFQSAVGVVQLKKLPQALAVHREHQAALMKAIEQYPYPAPYPAIQAWKFRDVPDVSGDLGDAVVIFLETEAQAQLVARRLFEKDKIALKNLPDALNWHFSGHWEHLLGREAATELPRSGALLRRTVAIQVCYHWDQARIEQIAKALVGAVTECQ